MRATRSCTATNLSGSEKATATVAVGNASGYHVGPGRPYTTIGAVPWYQLKAGDTFNELALMTGDATVADFIADSPCKVLLIPVSLFQSVVVSEPRAVQAPVSVIGQPTRADLDACWELGAAVAAGLAPE